MKILIGNTGFVGQNLREQMSFDYEFNSKNIRDLVNCPDECDLYLSCLPATKWLVNKNLKDDIKNIFDILNILKDKEYKNVYLMSSIDVYSQSPLESNEDYFPNYPGLSYGSNRLMFESLVREFISYENFYVFRLPALFGNHLKKNVIFDLLNNNQVERINTNSYYQWYDLEDLSSDILRFSSLHKKDSVFNLFTDPVYTKDLVDNFYPNKSIGYHGELVEYRYKTKYFSGGYLYDKQKSIDKIAKFIKKWQR